MYKTSFDDDIFQSKKNTHPKQKIYDQMYLFLLFCIFTVNQIKRNP